MLLIAKDTITSHHE